MKYRSSTSMRMPPFIQTHIPPSKPQHRYGSIFIQGLSGSANPQGGGAPGSRRYSENVQIKSKSSLAAPGQAVLNNQHASNEFPTLALTPSEELLAALGTLGKVYAKPESAQRRLDLSWITPLSMATDIKKRREQRRHNKARELAKQAETIQPSYRRSLASLLAKYIEHTNNFNKSEETACTDGQPTIEATEESVDDIFSDLSFLKLFNDQNLSWLREKGYEFTDLATWKWILTAQSADRGVMRLMLADQRSHNISGGKFVPTFILLLLLRRRDFNARGLRLILETTWKRLLHQSPDKSGKAPAGQLVYPEIFEGTIMIIVVRLVRQARRVWPAALMSIAEIMTKYIIGQRNWRKPMPHGEHEDYKESTLALLSFVYNRMLSLLSIPSNMAPFKSQIYHQRAQHIILLRMKRFQPALAITREGYRAVTSVQLQHPKTQSEREWAKMKSLSWPPWKESKLGINEDIDVEYGTSRAGLSLMQSREAGYPEQAWEKAAGVLAGRDTDGSPTIQTRAFLTRKGLFNHSESVDTLTKKAAKPDHTLWAMRIRATRTVDEAWDCFLSYKSQKESWDGLLTNMSRDKLWDAKPVYYAMCEKIVFGARRLNRPQNRYKDLSRCEAVALPGDGKETYSAPGPQQAIYVRTPAPSINEFFDIMTENKVKPTGRLLGLLLANAKTFTMGLKYLHASSLKFSTIQALLGRGVLTPEFQKAELVRMGEYLFTDFIKFLSNFASPFSGGATKHSLEGVFSEKAARKLNRKNIDALPHAFHLVMTRKPFYRPPWNWLLYALVRRERSTNKVRDHSRNLISVLAWKDLCRIVAQMHEIGLDIDFRGFQNLCIGLESSIRASHRLLLHESERSEHSSDQSFVLEHDSKTLVNFVTITGPVFLKTRFNTLVGKQVGFEVPTDQASELSNTIEVLQGPTEMPKPAHIHAFIRVLGFCRDFDGLLDLVGWMSDSAPSQFLAVADEPMPGHSLARRCIVAVRVFLERSWEEISIEEPEREGLDDDQCIAPPEILDKAMSIIARHEGWGGWPTDEEVKVYCELGSFD